MSLEKRSVLLLIGAAFLKPHELLPQVWRYLSVQYRWPHLHRLTLRSDDNYRQPYTIRTRKLGGLDVSELGFGCISNSVGHNGPA